MMFNYYGTIMPRQMHDPSYSTYQSEPNADTAAFDAAYLVMPRVVPYPAPSSYAKETAKKASNYEPQPAATNTSSWLHNGHSVPYPSYVNYGYNYNYTHPWPSSAAAFGFNDGSRVPYPSYGNNMRRAVITAKEGDVSGDGYPDNVFITADQTPDSPYLQNITLNIQNGKTAQYQSVALKENSGYNPTLFLGDFTGNRVNDILVTIDSGGSGGMIYAYVFSDLNGRLMQIFDSDDFNAQYQYDVRYVNNYKAQVLSLNFRQKYVIDLQYKGKEYLSEVYNPNGTLKQPVVGWVSPVSGLYPIDFDRNGTFELQAVQSISGRYNADGIGYMQTAMKWNGRAFTGDRQNAVIFGGDM
ncbi:hypothetical protein ACFQPF_17820 [Fictibacillus iocasae]|uniref:Spore coat protein n=1 Tax=Fictibacillus iocasae TaxID=2715437 RepID=A0ABW2NWA6_9BACL